MEVDRFGKVEIKASFLASPDVFLFVKSSKGNTFDWLFSFSLSDHLVATPVWQADVRNQQVERLMPGQGQGFGDGGGLSYDANFADSSQVTAERSEAETLALQLRDALAEVEHALDKLGQDRYGLCESCGKPIAPARLEAKPAARTCIDCASKR